MSLRRKIHLRLCAGAVLLTLPVAATSSNAVTGIQVAPTTSPVPGATTVAAEPFGSVVSNAVAPLGSVDPVAVARRVQTAGERHLRAASPTLPGGLGDVDLAELDIPRTALIAYQVAASTMRQADPDCGIDWSLLAAIGRVETDHGRHAGARLGADGISTPLIRGVALDGKGPVALIRDTDGGRVDGDEKWDRAVGPMQFLPSTWSHAGVDADGDGVRSPDNIHDAALGAAVYLCAAPGRLDRPAGVRSAVHRYNPSTAYVALVVRLAKAYQAGHEAEIPTGGTTLALGAIETGPTGGTTPPPSSGAGQGAQGGTDGQRDGDAGDAPSGDQGGKDGTEGKDRDTDGTTGAHVEQPGQDRPGKGGTNGGTGGKDGTEPPPDFGDEPPKPPKDPEPTPEPDPEPVLVEVTGLLTLLEDVVNDDGTTSDQWWLTEVYVDGVLVEDLLLDVGDESWLAATSLGDLDTDGILEANSDELLGLAERSELEAAQVVMTVEEDTLPAIVHTINGLSYRPTE